MRDELVAGYVQAAVDALTEQEDSLVALEIAEFYFGKALALKPNDLDLQLQFDFANKYLAAQSAFYASSWDEAIDNLEFIYTIQPDYAKGTARQSLYDAYTQRGFSYIAVGDYGNALIDFQQAAELTLEMGNAALLEYEAQINIAYALGLLREYREAVLLYEEALRKLEEESPNFNTDPDFQSALVQAEELSSVGNYPLAYLRYRELLNAGSRIYSNVVVHVVGPDDYLSQIALQYSTSVQAIVLINDISDPNRIFEGQELLIPILPEQ